MEYKELCRKKTNEILVIEDSAKKLGIRIAYSFTWGPPVESLDSSKLDIIIEELINTIKEKHDLATLKENPVVRAYRDFYWRIGVDPTKTRPAGEALVRRILRGVFPRINPIVDAGNLASAETMISIGLYDVSKIKFPCKITISRGGEKFYPIGGGVKELKPGIPILVDSNNKILHLYPHRDSIETAVKEDTMVVWVLAALVPGLPSDLGVEAVEKTLHYTRLLNWSDCGKVYLVE